MAESKPILSRRLLLWLLIIIGFYLFITAVQSILLPFIVGGLMAYFLDPVADRLEESGMGRGSAAGLITGLFFLVLILGIMLLIPMIARELNDLIEALPGYIQQYRHMLEAQISHIAPAQAEKAKAAMNEQAENLVPVAKELVAGLFNSGRALVNFITLIVITPIVGFYLLRDWDHMVVRLHTLLPRDHVETIKEQMAEMDRTISGYLHGTLNVMLILGLFYIIGLSIVGLDFALIIGIVGGIAIIIPYLGTVISGGLAVGMAYLQFDSLTPVIITLAIFSAGQMLEGYILTPKLVGNKINLHPLWLIFGMLAGGALFGFVGILLAIPVTAILGVLTRFAIAHYKESELYLGHKKRS